MDKVKLGVSLVKPDSRYQASYLEAIAEMAKSGESNYIRNWDDLSEEHYFLVDKDKHKYLGLLELRLEPRGKFEGLESHIHYSIAPTERGKDYGKEILRLGLSKARELGLHEVIITCKKDNLSSVKIIEANGGRLLSQVDILGDQGDTITINKYEVVLRPYGE